MKNFYAYLRSPNSHAFGSALSQSEVDGIEAILAELSAKKATLEEAAYVLATGYGETGGRMQPVRENMRYSAARAREVWPSKFKSVAAAKKYEFKPYELANYVYDGKLGNRPGTDDGWNFRGALIGQFTGRDHFVNISKRIGIDLAANPDLLNDLGIAAKSLVRGMLEGWATAFKLSDFINAKGTDYLGARRVWNGTFEADKYAEWAKDFERALKAAGWSAKPLSAPATIPATNFSFVEVFIKMLKKLIGGK